VLLAGAIALAWVASGCGKIDGLKRYSLTGAITFQGVAVPAGEIYFEPDPTHGNRGPASVASIVSGRYRLPAAKGHVGGGYVFRVIGFKEAPGPLGPPGQPATPPQLLFANVEIKGDLPKANATYDIDVPTPTARGK